MTDTTTRLAAHALLDTLEDRARAVTAVFNVPPGVVLLGRHEVALLAAVCLISERRAVAPIAETVLGLRLVRVDADRWLEVASLLTLGPVPRTTEAAP